MPYKDKEKAKEASAERMRRFRQGVTEGVTEVEGVTQPVKAKGVTEGVTKAGCNIGGVTITKEKAIKLLKIAVALDREITGLVRRENMLDLVRYGDLTMREVREQLCR